MAGILFFAERQLGGYLAGSGVERAGALIMLVALGLAVFSALAHCFGAIKVSELRSMLDSPRVRD
jgi:hypothetical protein